MTFELRKDKTCYLRVLGRLYRVTILGVSEDTFWVTFPAMDYPLEGMGVDLEFHDLKGYHIYHTRVVVSPEKRGDSVVLQRSESVQYRQHRSSWRVTTEIAVDVSLRPTAKTFAGSILNLGSKGALLQVDQSLSEGDLVDLSFSLPNGDAIRVCGQILRADENSEYGLTFLDVSPEASTALVKFVWAELRKHSRDDLRKLYPTRGDEAK